MNYYQLFFNNHPVANVQGSTFEEVAEKSKLWFKNKWFGSDHCVPSDTNVVAGYGPYQDPVEIKLHHVSC